MEFQFETVEGYQSIVSSLIETFREEGISGNVDKVADCVGDSRVRSPNAPSQGVIAECAKLDSETSSE